MKRKTTLEKFRLFYELTPKDDLVIPLIKARIKGKK